MTPNGLKVICAWCKNVMREGRPPVSHGVCENCAAAVLARMLEDEQGVSGQWKRKQFH